MSHPLKVSTRVPDIEKHGHGGTPGYPRTTYIAEQLYSDETSCRWNANVLHMVLAPSKSLPVPHAINCLWGLWALIQETQQYGQCCSRGVFRRFLLTWLVALTEISSRPLPPSISVCSAETMKLAAKAMSSRGQRSHARAASDLLAVSSSMEGSASKCRAWSTAPAETRADEKLLRHPSK